MNGTEGEKYANLGLVNKNRCSSYKVNGFRALVDLALLTGIFYYYTTREFDIHIFFSPTPNFFIWFFLFLFIFLVGGVKVVGHVLFTFQVAKGYH